MPRSIAWSRSSSSSAFSPLWEVDSAGSVTGSLHWVSFDERPLRAGTILSASRGPFTTLARRGSAVAEVSRLLPPPLHAAGDDE